MLRKRASFSRFLSHVAESKVAKAFQFRRSRGGIAVDFELLGFEKTTLKYKPLSLKKGTVFFGDLVS